MAESLLRSRIAITSLFFLNGFTFASWATRIPAIQKQFDLSEGTLGLILASIAFGAILSMSSAAALSKRFGTRAICIFSTVAFLVSLIAVPLAPTAVILGILVFMLGATHGLLDVAMNVQAVDIEKMYNRPIMSSIHAGWSIGGLFGAIYGTTMTYMEWSVFAQFALNSGIGLVAFCLFCRDMLPGMHPIVETDAAASSRVSSAGRWQLFILGAMAFCIMLGEGAMADWTAVFLSKEFNVGESVAAIGYAMFAICMASGRLMGDWFTKVLGVTMQIRLCGIMAMAGVMLAVLSRSPIQSIIGFGMIGAGFSTIVPILFTLSGRVSNISSSAALSAVSSIGYFGLLLGPPMIGFAAEITSLRWSLMIVFIATSVSLVLTFLLNSYHTIVAHVAPIELAASAVDAAAGELAIAPDSSPRLSA